MPYIVPPETAIEVSEPTNASIRCKGDLLKLAVGEVMPTHLMGRFKEQPTHYLTFEYDTVDWGTGYTFAIDEEVEVISKSPNTTEKVVFKGLVEAKLVGWDRAAVHQVSLRFYLDNAPLDFILKETKVGGIDLWNTPYPPKVTTEPRGYNLLPGIAVLGDHTISLKIRNIKGVAIDIGVVAGNGPFVAAAYEYQRIG